MYGKGPITDPNDLGPAIKDAHRGGQEAANRR